MSQTQLDSYPRRAQPKEIWVRLRVIADDMTASGNLAHHLRALSDVAPDQKERRWRFVAIKEVKQLRSDGRIRPIVKGDCQLSRRVRAANCGAKKLRARMHAAVSDNPRRGSRDRRRSHEPRIHRVILAWQRLRGILLPFFRDAATRNALRRLHPGKRRRVFRSVNKRSISMSRSMRVSRSPASSPISTISAVATASV